MILFSLPKLHVTLDIFGVLGFFFRCTVATFHDSKFSNATHLYQTISKQDKFKHGLSNVIDFTLYNSYCTFNN